MSATPLKFGDERSIRVARRAACVAALIEHCDLRGEPLSGCVCEECDGRGECPCCGFGDCQECRGDGFLDCDDADADADAIAESLMNMSERGFAELCERCEFVPPHPNTRGF